MKSVHYFLIILYFTLTLTQSCLYLRLKVYMCSLDSGADGLTGCPAGSLHFAALDSILVEKIFNSFQRMSWTTFKQRLYRSVYLIDSVHI